MSVVYKQVVYFIFQLIFFIESGLLINFLFVQIRKCSVSCRRAFHKKPPTKQTEKQAKKKTPCCWCTCTDEKISGVGVNNKMLSKMVFCIDMKVACIAIAEKRMHNPR